MMGGLEEIPVVYLGTFFVGYSALAVIVEGCLLHILASSVMGDLGMIPEMNLVTSLV